MSGTLHKKLSVAEQILVVLMSGSPAPRVVTHAELLITLQGILVPGRIPTYMWELKKRGALIVRTGAKQNVSYTLMNRETMLSYLQDRRNAGAIVPDVTGLTAAVTPVVAAPLVTEAELAAV
jgi:hypothetical protein